MIDEEINKVPSSHNMIMKHTGNGTNNQIFCSLNEYEQIIEKAQLTPLKNLRNCLEIT